MDEVIEVRINNGDLIALKKCDEVDTWLSGLDVLPQRDPIEYMIDFFAMGVENVQIDNEFHYQYDDEYKPNGFGGLK